MWAGGATDQQSLERTGAAVVPFGVGNSEELIRMVALTKATAIHCTPSYLAKLEACMQKDLSASPRTLQLKLGLFGGEAGLQDSRFRTNIESTWGFRAVDANYGLADVLSMFGSECSVRDGLHFMGQGVVHPEIVAIPAAVPLPWQPGAQGELVLTHLQKDCQPLVRYRTGDLIEVADVEPCLCGRKSPRFKVVGRIDDMLVIRGINVFPGAIAKVVNNHLDVVSGEYGIFVSRCDPIERIVLRLELRKGADSNIPRQALIQRLLEDCRTTLSVRPEIELLEAGEFPKSTDKTKRVQRVL
jgi:phenylacetate-CoA ligase